MLVYYIGGAVDDDILEEYVLEENKVWGGKRSFSSTKEKPVMIHGHDEVAIH
jgi:hypothetical protein